LNFGYRHRTESFVVDDGGQRHPKTKALVGFGVQVNGVKNYIVGEMFTTELLAPVPVVLGLLSLHVR
jgi:hypothetical protein